MARTKATVRRLPVETCHLPAWIVNREYGTKKRTTVNITKNRQVIKTINVRKKSKCFTG